MVKSWAVCSGSQSRQWLTCAHTCLCNISPAAHIHHPPLHLQFTFRVQGKPDRLAQKDIWASGICQLNCSLFLIYSEGIQVRIPYCTWLLPHIHPKDTLIVEQPFHLAAGSMKTADVSSSAAAFNFWHGVLPSIFVEWHLLTEMESQKTGNKTDDGGLQMPREGEKASAQACCKAFPRPLLQLLFYTALGVRPELSTLSLTPVTFLVQRMLYSSSLCPQ